VPHAAADQAGQRLLPISGNGGSDGTNTRATEIADSDRYRRKDGSASESRWQRPLVGKTVGGSISGPGEGKDGPGVSGPTMGSTINRGIPFLGGVKVRAEESAWLKFVDRKAENDSWHGRYAMEFCPLADKYASEDHSSIRIPRELSRAVLRINIEGSGKGRGGQVAQAIVHYDCVRPRSNYMFSATIVSSRYRCRYPQPRKRSWRNP
jgi:hypothetical protein